MSIFKQILLSCTSFDFYIDIYKNNYKTTLKCLLSFLLIAGIATSVMRVITIHEKFERVEKWAEQTTPIFKDGELTLTKPALLNVSYNHFTFIINTEDNVKIIPDKYTAGLMLTKKHMILKNYDNQTKKLYDKNDKAIIFTPSVIAEYKAAFLSLLLFIMLPGGIITFIIMKLFTIILFAIISRIYINMFTQTEESFNFQQIINICSYSAIAPTLFMLLFFNKQNTTVVNMIYFAMYAAFTGGAIAAIKKTFKTKEEQDI